MKHTAARISFTLCAKSCAGFVAASASNHVRYIICASRSNFSAHLSYIKWYKANAFNSHFHNNYLACKWSNTHHKSDSSFTLSSDRFASTLCVRKLANNKEKKICSLHSNHFLFLWLHFKGESRFHTKFNGSFIDDSKIKSFLISLVDWDKTAIHRLRSSLCCSLISMLRYNFPTLFTFWSMHQCILCNKIFALRRKSFVCFDGIFIYMFMFNWLVLYFSRHEWDRLSKMNGRIWT